MKSFTRWPLLAGGLVLAGVLVLFSGMVLAVRGSASTEPPPRTITIKVKDIQFEPDTISARVGQPVMIRLENDDDMDHAFSIDALNVSTDIIGPRQVTSVILTPQQAGTYQFYCPMPGHAQLGMVGTLQVVP